MADFNKSFEKTMGHEGGYVNDPDDKGGETYCGISRRWQPNWSGWLIIDAYKKAPDFRKCLKNDEGLAQLVRDFYRIEFWNRISGDKIQAQYIADEMFDTIVNMNPRKPRMFLQRVLNCLNRNESLYPDLVVDGAIGPATLSAMDKLNSDDTKLLFNMLNVLQGNHYIEEMERDSEQEKYCRGWFSRVTIVQGE